MYKAKISKIQKNIFSVDIPSLGLYGQTAYLILDKGAKSQYVVGDLVIVSELNTGEYIIMGYVFNGN